MPLLASFCTPAQCKSILQRVAARGVGGASLFHYLLIVSWESVWNVLKWVLAALVAGFIGQFGRSLALHLMRRRRDRRAEQSEKPDESPLDPRLERARLEAESKIEKKRAKAELKRTKKTATRKTKAED
jgi:flagellar biosynthesis/type III secretory pathway M-ring protein FliF/YscJ